MLANTIDPSLGMVDPALGMGQTARDKIGSLNHSIRVRESLKSKKHKRKKIDAPDYLDLVREARARVRPSKTGRQSTIRNKATRVRLGL